MSAIIANASDASREQAISILEKGGLVAIPTETVYGLGSDATSDIAVAKIYETKGRPSFNPLISHVHDLDSALVQGEFNKTALRLADKFWPGPLTIIVPFMQTGTVCDLARAGLRTIAVRVPLNKFTLELLEEFKKPIVAPSANLSGKLSPTCADHVNNDLGEKIELIIDDGPSSNGIESTVIDCTHDTPRLLRFGAIPHENIEKFIGPLEAANLKNDAPASPGQLLKHYAPNAVLRVNVTKPNPNEALLGFGKTINATLNLSKSGNLVEAASNLFSMLRELDKDYDKIGVVPIPNMGIGIAINDRLWRATK